MPCHTHGREKCAAVCTSSPIGWRGDAGLFCFDLKEVNVTVFYCFFIIFRYSLKGVHNPFIVSFIVLHIRHPPRIFFQDLPR